MHSPLVVLTAVKVAGKQRKFGSIVAPLFSQKAAGESIKSFICVSAIRFGGLGVRIGHR